ncbi:hypothetical protein EYF80_010828 [Liparis tanakae]|uniref:Uncharacterized protein n=1 Tax=Liparis tanakae TaxID=230148 RepID=A0A4Z2INV2_9TELE|nr:hypothetical protein EYF80_010828 [Liparis tanakae]
MPMKARSQKARWKGVVKCFKRVENNIPKRRTTSQQPANSPTDKQAVVRFSTRFYNLAAGRVIRLAGCAIVPPPPPVRANRCEEREVEHASDTSPTSQTDRGEERREGPFNGTGGGCRSREASPKDPGDEGLTTPSPQGADRPKLLPEERREARRKHGRAKIARTLKTGEGGGGANEETEEDRGRVPVKVVIRLLLNRAERVFASARLQAAAAAAAAEGYRARMQDGNPMRVWHSRGSRDAKDEEVSGERTDEQTADDGEGGTEGDPRAERTPLQQHRSVPFVYSFCKVDGPQLVPSLVAGADENRRQFEIHLSATGCPDAVFFRKSR